MGVKVETQVTVICDICKDEITSGNLVEAGTYGVYAGEQCFNSLTPAQVVRFLGLDEVRIGPRMDYGYGRDHQWWDPTAMDEGRVKRLYETAHSLINKP